MKKNSIIAIILIVGSGLYYVSNYRVPTALTNINVDVSRCRADNNTYYKVHGSQFDGSNNIYDRSGNKLAECGGGWGNVPDPYPELCTKIDTARCRVIKK